MKRLLPAAILLLLSGCSDRKPATGAIDTRKFEDIYVELLDSAKTVQSSPDSQLSPVAQRILERHGVTVEQFHATIQDYNNDTDRWGEFFEDVAKRMDERSKAPPQ